LRKRFAQLMRLQKQQKQLAKQTKSFVKKDLDKLNNGKGNPPFALAELDDSVLPTFDLLLNWSVFADVSRMIGGLSSS
jgi:hypothetical protein